MGGLRQDPDLAKERSTTRVSPVCGQGASVCCSCRPHASTCGERQGSTRGSGGLDGGLRSATRRTDHRAGPGTTRTGHSERPAAPPRRLPRAPPGRAGEARGRHGRLAVTQEPISRSLASSLGLTSSRPVVRRPRRGCVWPGWIARSRRCTGRRTLGRLWTAAPGVRVPGWSCVPSPSRVLRHPSAVPACRAECVRCRSGGQRMVLGGVSGEPGLLRRAERMRESPLVLPR